MRGVVVVAVLLGCTTSSNSSIHGKLLVHTGGAPTCDSVHVLLGDGTQYDAAVDGNGDALFEDRTLAGPQNVTAVWVQGAMVWANTGIAIDREEVWFSQRQCGAYQPSPLLGAVTGRVLDASVPTNVDVRAFGPTLWGEHKAQATGNYEVDYTGTDGMFDLVAYEQDSQGATIRAGLVRDLMSSSKTIADIALDHELDQSRSIDVRGVDAYEPPFTVSIAHSQDGDYLFPNTVTNPSLPATVMTIVPTAPFDKITLVADASAGNSGCAPPAGCSETATPLGSSNTRLDLLAPPVIVSPTIDMSMVSTPLDGLDFLWRPDPRSQFAKLFIWDIYASNTEQFYWNITAPASAAEFAPFTLPADAAPRSLGRKLVSIGVMSQRDSRVVSYGDLWTEQAAQLQLTDPFFWEADDHVTFSETHMFGALNLQ